MITCLPLRERGERVRDSGQRVYPVASITISIAGGPPVPASRPETCVRRSLRALSSDGAHSCQASPDASRLARAVGGEESAIPADAPGGLLTCARYIGGELARAITPTRSGLPLPPIRRVSNEDSQGFSRLRGKQRLERLLGRAVLPGQRHVVILQ